MVYFHVNHYDFQKTGKQNGLCGGAQKHSGRGRENFVRNQAYCAAVQFLESEHVKTKDDMDPKDSDLYLENTVQDSR